MAGDGHHATYVAVIDGRPVAMAAAVIQHVFEQDEPLGRIIAVSVDAAYRRVGIGSALIKTVEGWIRSQGASLVMINSGTHRTDAHNFYEQAGYVSKGVSFAKKL